MQYMVQTALADNVQKLGAISGTAVLLNARTGAVAAMAGAPTFDPNQYGSYANQTGCVGKESVCLTPALYCAYELGSTMNPVTMAAALDPGLITPETPFYQPG